MSRWAVICLYCDAWLCETDDMADGADKADAHLEVCEGRPTDPFTGAIR
jgi:hypothetical protein